MANITDMSRVFLDKYPDAYEGTSPGVHFQIMVSLSFLPRLERYTLLKLFTLFNVFPKLSLKRIASYMQRYKALPMVMVLN